MKKSYLFVILYLLFLPGFLCSQPYSKEEIIQGYTYNENEVTFIFSEALYDVHPELVVITGAFRNWDQDMTDTNWRLQPSDGLWILTISNHNYSNITPGSKFKYRIDQGTWLAPPAIAENQSGGNLEFMHDVIMTTLKAELVNEQVILASINQNRPVLPSAFRILDVFGNEMPVKQVLPRSATESLIIATGRLNKKKNYFLEVPSLELRAHCSFDGWFKNLYSSKQLGANINGDQTSIRIFSPRADLVRLYLYHNKEDSNAITTIDMNVDEQGVWEATIPRNLHGIYYDFTVHGLDEPGNHFYETTPVHITDPYARVSDDTWGKARIWNKTIPATPLRKGIPSIENIIAYEVHVQDFTDRLPVEDKLKGTFRAMITPHLTNQNGHKIGFDYLVDLGINVVHLMPVQQYLHYPDKEWQASFKDDPYMIEQGVHMENYQWGYRTSHAFAVESRYRSKGSEPGTERNEFRDLVQAFHDQDIAVIIDIVPNHTAENMDGNNWFFNFNVLDKQYYYRTANYEHIGAYGNEVKTENRPMTQRWLIDQCLHFIEEFGVDGFRIDLAGQIDKQTLIALKNVIGHDKIVYGEAWIGSNDPEFEANPDWDWYKEDAPITFFQDDARNAFKGPVFVLNTKEDDRGWPGGNSKERENVMKGLSNSFKDDKTPVSGINYLDIHDNFALADQFGTVNFNGLNSVDQDEYKIAVTLLYTSLGPIVTHGGSEIMRSKAHAPLQEVVKETISGYKISMHGYRDTYNHRTANQFLWNTVGQEPSNKNQNNYQNMHAFWRGMNAFRLSEYGKVFRVADEVPEDYYNWILPDDKNMLGYIVDRSILVLLNAGHETRTFENIVLPDGRWKLIANTERTDHILGVEDKDQEMELEGGQNISIRSDPTSLYIWVKE